MSGVAKSTVSRYLNRGEASKMQRPRRSKKIIEENNYEPNLFARLNAKESRIIGLTVPGFNSVTTPRLVEVIVAYLKKNDYTPLIMHTENDIEEEIRCIERLKNMNVDGIMVLATGSTKGIRRSSKEVKNFQSCFLDNASRERILSLMMITMQDMRWVIISDNVSSRRFICSGYLKMTRQ